MLEISPQKDKDVDFLLVPKPEEITDEQWQLLMDSTRYFNTWLPSSLPDAVDYNLRQLLHTILNTEDIALLGNLLISNPFSTEIIDIKNRLSYEPGIGFAQLKRLIDTIIKTYQKSHPLGSKLSTSESETTLSFH